ncbi:Ku protein [Acidobacteria bacterium AH-259-D05]|nr:Ku protein [Acidobacteria bacterium AH-259-D05]
MSALWSGSITFGLVSIPVRLETSQRGKGLSFNFLHKKCQQRVSQKFYCPTCDQYVDRRDLLRGFEHQKDRYVVVPPEDFEKVEGGASRNIEVISFVDRSELQPAHLNRTYYLVPENGAEKGYLLLLKGMQKTNTVAMTRFVMRGKEYIGAVGSSSRGLMLQILFHKGEYRRMEEVVELPEVELSDKELDLATQIIENLREEFSEDMLVNLYQERLMEVIRQKVDGEQVVLAEKRKPAKVVDLMEALKRSLSETAQKKPAARVTVKAKSQAGKTSKQKRRRA